MLHLLALRIRPMAVAFGCGIAAVFIACEKNNDVVVQEQLRESAAACDKGCEEHVAGCDIKGNISTGGNKFYHVPGSPNYDLKIVQPEKGERWFCTEEQAQKNGYVRKDS